MNEAKKTRLLDRTTYSRKTLDIFEIIAAFFVDMYYNHTYIEAKTLKANGRVNSITEGYKHVLGRFFKALDDHNIYKKTLMSMHSFASVNGIYSNIRLTVFIKHVVDEFVPTEFRESLTSSQENIMLREIIKSLNQNLIRKIMEQYLVLIIDKHMDADNVRLIQEDVIDMLILEREAMYQKFYLTSKHKKNNINITMLNKLKDELKESYVCQAKLKKLILRMNQVLAMKDRQLSEKTQEIEDLRKLIDNGQQSYHETMQPIYNETTQPTYQQNQQNQQNQENDSPMYETDMEEKHEEPQKYENSRQLDAIESIIDVDTSEYKHEPPSTTPIAPPPLDLFVPDENHGTQGYKPDIHEYKDYTPEIQEINPETQKNNETQDHEPQFISFDV
jgi:hypothetical protein